MQRSDHLVDFHRRDIALFADIQYEKTVVDIGEILLHKV